MIVQYCVSFILNHLKYIVPSDIKKSLKMSCLRRFWSTQACTIPQLCSLAPSSISVNCRPLLTTWLPFLLSWFFCVAGDRNKPVSLNLLRLWCKVSGVSKIIYVFVSGGYQKSHYSLQPSKNWKYDQHHLFPVCFKQICLLYEFM